MLANILYAENRSEHKRAKGAGLSKNFTETLQKRIWRLASKLINIAA